MSILFFDTSALAKRYMPEIGMAWVRTQTTSSAGHDIVIAQITPVELYSAISRKYHDGIFDLQQLQAFRQLFTSSISGYGTDGNCDYPCAKLTRIPPFTCI